MQRYYLITCWFHSSISLIINHLLSNLYCVIGIRVGIRSCYQRGKTFRNNMRPRRMLKISWNWTEQAAETLQVVNTHPLINTIAMKVQWGPPLCSPQLTNSEETGSSLQTSIKMVAPRKMMTTTMMRSTMKMISMMITILYCRSQVRPWKMRTSTMMSKSRLLTEQGSLKTPCYQQQARMVFSRSSTWWSHLEMSSNATGQRTR